MFKNNWRVILTVYMLFYFGSFALYHMTGLMDLGVYRFAFLLPIFGGFSTLIHTIFDDRFMLIKQVVAFAIMVAYFGPYLAISVVLAVIITDVMILNFFDVNSRIKSVFAGLSFSLCILIISLTITSVFEAEGVLKSITFGEIINVILITAIFTMIVAIGADILGIRIKMWMEKK